jgi:hypothetical protein
MSETIGQIADRENDIAERTREWLAIALEDLMQELMQDVVPSGGEMKSVIGVIEGVARFAADVVCAGDKSADGLARSYAAEFICERIQSQVAVANLGAPS